MARFEIDTVTGEWLTHKPLSLRESCVIAASVLPGTTPDDIWSLYFDTDPTSE